MNNIYGMTPINKSAAVVTSQNGCANNDDLSDEQKRKNLVLKLKALEVELLSHPKKSKKRQELGQEKNRLMDQVNAIRPKKRCKDLKDHILDILREELTPYQFKRIIRKASERAKNTN